MMTDIVERLRGLAAERKARGSGAISTIDPTITGWLDEAADEIERLRRGLRMLVAQEYDSGYSPERYAEAVLSGHDAPVIKDDE